MRLVGAVLLLLAAAPVAAQDIRGLEVCTAEKDMTRRTSCLQSNVEFLQAALRKASADAQQKLSANSAQLAAAQREIITLKDAVTKLQARIGELEKKKDEKK